MKRKITAGLGLASLLVGLMSSVASAHVVVKPAEVGVGAYQTFVMGVPVEKDIPTVGVRLVIPDNIQSVTPNVKPGWTIDVKKTGEGESAKVSEVTWTGGSIPAGQRDEFAFSAKTPSKAGEIQWKAYQTYEDGEVAAWDQAPVSEKHDDKDDANAPEPTPYSVTKVVNDLDTGNSTTAVKATKVETSSNNTGVALGMIAIVLAVIAIAMASQNRSIQKGTNPKSKR